MKQSVPQRISLVVVIFYQAEEEGAIHFEEKPVWGIDLGSEHERYLCEHVIKKPVIVTNYPKKIKVFECSGLGILSLIFDVVNEWMPWLDL